MVILEGQAGDAKAAVDGAEAEKEEVKTAVPLALESILFEHCYFLTAGLCNTCIICI